MSAAVMSLPRRDESLLEDQRGAVMLTGLFMAFCLIGALWYVIGIGEALIFRDRMQEAADSAAFTGAVMNAKGMNFISVCNIIMLILVVVYLVFAVIQDATILTCLACFPCLICCAACPFVPDVIETNHSVARVVKTGLNVMTALECAAAIGYPWMGTMRAKEVGNTYTVRENRNSNADDKNTKASTWALGMSNIPALGGGWAGPVPLGLPVEGKAYGDLCAKVGEDLVGLLKGFIGMNVPLGKIADFIGKALGAAIKIRYCNDLGEGVLDSVKKMFGDVKKELQTGDKQTQAANDPKNVGPNGQLTFGFENQDPNAAKKINVDAPFEKGEEGKWNGWSPWFDPGFDRGWGDKGFLVTHASAGNGRQPHQIWGINKSPRYNDDNQKKVSFGARTRKQDFDSDKDNYQTPAGWGYFSQAEFYFDCEEDWSGEDCNDDDNASFSIRWRARLRRVEMVSLASILQQFLFNKFAEKIGEAVEKVVSGVIGGFIPGGEMFAKTGLGGAVIDAAAGMINDEIVDPLLDILQGQLDKLSSAISPTTIEGAYH